MSRPEKLEDWTTADIVAALLERYRDTRWPFYWRVAEEIRRLERRVFAAEDADRPCRRCS